MFGNCRRWNPSCLYTTEMPLCISGWTDRMTRRSPFSTPCRGCSNRVIDLARVYASMGRSARPPMCWKGAPGKYCSRNREGSGATPADGSSSWPVPSSCPRTRPARLGYLYAGAPERANETMNTLSRAASRAPEICRRCGTPHTPQCARRSGSSLCARARPRRLLARKRWPQWCHPTTAMISCASEYSNRPSCHPVRRDAKRRVDAQPNRNSGARRATRDLLNPKALERTGAVGCAGSNLAGKLMGEHDDLANAERAARVMAGRRTKTTSRSMNAISSGRSCYGTARALAGLARARSCRQARRLGRTQTYSRQPSKQLWRADWVAPGRSRYAR